VVLGDPIFIIGKMKGKFFKVSWGNCKLGASVTYTYYLIRYCFNKTEAKSVNDHILIFKS